MKCVLVTLPLDVLAQLLNLPDGVVVQNVQRFEEDLRGKTLTVYLEGDALGDRFKVAPGEMCMRMSPICHEMTFLHIEGITDEPR